MSGLPSNEAERWSGRIEQRVVRFATAAGLAGALALALLGPVPAHLPAIAFDSRAMYALERSAAAFLGWSAFVGLSARGFRGEVPSGFGRDGLTYQRRVEHTSDEIRTTANRDAGSLREIELRLGQAEEAHELTRQLAYSVGEQLADLRRSL
ncbi:MAG TPA: hypothetical protein VID70_08175 [Solirubrobacteraceae bacterium]|jgi:hypothetical protein